MTLRERIEQKIIKDFERVNPLDELNISCINFHRKRIGKELLVDQVLNPDGFYDVKPNPNFDISVFVSRLDDEELLEVLDSQACQKYR